MPWLTGMVALFAFEFIEGNTITRLYFMRLRRVTREAVQRGKVTAELEEVRREHVPTFTHSHYSSWLAFARRRSRECIHYLSHPQ